MNIATRLTRGWTSTLAKRTLCFTALVLSDRKSTRLNSSHSQISYAVFCLKTNSRVPEDREVGVVSAADPLNLVGIILPGRKVSSVSGLAIAYRNGATVDVAPMGALLSKL